MRDLSMSLILLLLRVPPRVFSSSEGLATVFFPAVHLVSSWSWSFAIQLVPSTPSVQMVLSRPSSHKILLSSSSSRVLSRSPLRFLSLRVSTLRHSKSPPRSLPLIPSKMFHQVPKIHLTPQPLTRVVFCCCLMQKH